MNIQDENVTYRTQPHEMWIEGMTDKEPTISEIDEYCVKNNYSVDNIQIWFDHMQQIWRFNGDITKIKICNWPYKSACSRFVKSKNFCKTCEYFK